MASAAPEPFSAIQSVTPSDQAPVGSSWPLASSSMSRVTFHSNSTSLGTGPDGAPPPPPPPVMTGGRMMGASVMVMVTLPIPLPSWLTERSMVSSASSSESVTAMIITLTDLAPAGSVTTYGFESSRPPSTSVKSSTGVAVPPSVSVIVWGPAKVTPSATMVTVTAAPSATSSLLAESVKAATSLSFTVTVALLTAARSGRRGGCSCCPG